MRKRSIKLDTIGWGSWPVQEIEIWHICTNHEPSWRMRRVEFSRDFEIQTNHLMLYNCGKIFFILSFFVGYILSLGLVRLRTIRLSARVGAHIECRCSHSCGEDVTITDVIVNPPDRKWDWGCEWRHARKRWAEDLGWFLKKSRFEARRSELIFGPRQGQFSYGLRDARALLGQMEQST